MERKAEAPVVNKTKKHVNNLDFIFKNNYLCRDRPGESHSGPRGFSLSILGPKKFSI